MNIISIMKKVVKKVIVKKEEGKKPSVCIVCSGIGRVSEKVSCDTCKGTGLPQ